MSLGASSHTFNPGVVIVHRQRVVFTQPMSVERLPLSSHSNIYGDWHLIKQHLMTCNKMRRTNSYF